MTNIAENVQRNYRSFMRYHSQKVVRNLPKRLLNSFKFTGLVAIVYGGLISLPKLFSEFNPGFEQYANMDYIEYLKLMYSGVKNDFPIALGIGAFMPELSKSMHWVAYQPRRLVGQGIDYISNSFKNLNNQKT